MKRNLIYALSVAGLLTACAHHPGDHSVSNGEARAENRAEAHETELPRRHHKGDRMASAGDTLPATDPSNTATNARDRGGDTLTPMDQGNSEIDLDLTQRIRKAVMADGSLSFTAKNAKIISRDGQVTLRGTVNSASEKTAIGKAATDAAGVGHVTNQLDVDPS